MLAVAGLFWMPPTRNISIPAPVLALLITLVAACLN
jgi:hypothetical protein